MALKKNQKDFELDPKKIFPGQDAQAKVTQVSFQRQNPDFLLKNPGFLIRNRDFLLKNVDFIIKTQVLKFLKALPCSKLPLSPATVRCYDGATATTQRILTKFPLNRPVLDLILTTP